MLLKQDFRNKSNGTNLSFGNNHLRSSLEYGRGEAKSGDRTSHREQVQGRGQDSGC